MTDKRERIITDPGLGPTDPHRPSMLRSVEAIPEAELDSNAPVYYEPSPLVAISNHRTLELETVKLSADIDPRKLQTELRMDRAPSYAPPPDSFWPPETALATSQPPPSPGRRWRAPVVLLSVLCALLLLVVGRAVARHSAALAARQSGIAQSVSGAGLVPLGATLSTASVARSVAVASPVTIQSATAPVAVPAPIDSTTKASAATVTPAVDTVAHSPATSAPAPTAADIVSASAPLGSASVGSASVGSASAASVSPDSDGVSNASNATARVRGAAAPAHAAKLNPPLDAPLAAPSASKPKRAIY